MKSLKKLSVLLFTLVFAMAELLSFSINAFAAEPTTIVNLSKGKSYTNIGYLSPSTPDTNGKELTDGVFGSRSNKDAAWNGTWHRSTESGMVYDEWPLYTTTIDLGGVKSITQVKANFLRFYNAYAHMPKTMKVYASVDGENWMKISYLNNIPWDIADGIYSFGWHVADHSGNKTTDVTGNANSSVRARYVRFDYESREGYTLMDEVTVMGYNGEKSGAITPYNTRKLENDKIMLAGAQTGNIQDMVLIYQNRSWTKETLKPYLTYVDTAGNSVDTLYDTALFLKLSSPDGKNYDKEDENLVAKDWTDYLNQTFVGSTSTIYALNEAAKQASIDLNMPDYKVNLVVMVPYPAASAKNFGEINGRTLDLSVESDWKYLIDWYLNEVIDYVNNGNYDYIDFKGFYWVNEAPIQIPRIIYTNDRIDELGYKSYWIPFFHSEGYFWNEDLGFSALTLQPNHFFAESTGNTLGNGGTKIIETVAKLGAYANFGVEMEFDGRFSDDIDAYNRFLDYLNAAVKMGFDGPGYFRNWYEAGGAILQIYNSKSPEHRMLYDNIYQMIKGDYVQREYLDDFNKNLLLGKSYTHNATSWYADRSNDSGCTYLTDGITNGTYYGSEYLGVKNQNVTVEMDFSSAPVSFKELHVQTLIDSKSAVNTPKSVKISVKSPVTSNWEVIYDGDYPDSSRAVFRTDSGVNAAGLKFEFVRDGSFLFIKEILAYDKVTGVGRDASLMGSGNILSGKTYTHNVTNWYQGASRDSGTALTDGVKGGSFYGTDYLNAYQTPVTIEFDLGGAINVSELYIESLKDTSAAVNPPKSAKIYFKENDTTEWNLVYSGPVKEKNFTLTADAPIKTSKIKVELEGENDYIFIKEIEAYSFARSTSSNGKLVKPVNLIEGLTPASGSTTINTYAWQSATDAKILTDGAVRTDAVSYKQNITFSDTPVTFVYEKSGMSFKEVNVHLNNPTDLTVRSISGMKVEGYINGKWITLANRQDIPDYTEGKTYAFTSDGAVTADKVRITLTKSTTTPCDWNGLSISEIQVLGEVVTEEPIGTFVAMEKPEITTSFGETVEIYSGDGFTLDVSATVSDGGTLSYQWYKDGAEISGATSHFYTVVNATAADAGEYTVKVTSSGTLPQSVAEASVNVVYDTAKTNLAADKSYTWADYAGTTMTNYPDTDLKEMTDGIVSSRVDYYDTSYSGFKTGKDVELVIDLGSRQPVSKVNAVLMSTNNAGLGMPKKVRISYSIDNKKWYVLDMWEQNDGTAKGVMVASVAPLTAPLARFVKVTLLNDGFIGSAFISEVQVFGEYREPVVAATPVIEKDLNTSLNVYEGNKLTLSVVASAENGALSYQWYKDGAAISGATKSEYTVTAKASDSGNYKVVVTNVAEDSTASKESVACAVTVLPSADTPVITKDLDSSVNITEGDAVMLSVEATAKNGTLTYQWYKDGMAISGANSAFCNVTEAGTYKVTVTNTLGDTKAYADSNECVVTVETHVDDALTFSKDKVSAGETFVMTFTHSETAVVSGLSLNIKFDNEAFELVEVAHSDWADMQPDVNGCNNNANLAISWVDPTFDANTDITAGTVLIEATFKAKEDATLGDKAFEIFDYIVTGAFNEETYMPEDITPNPGSRIKYVTVQEPVVDALTFSKEEVSAGETFVMTFTHPKTVVTSGLSLNILFDNEAFEIMEVAHSDWADMQPDVDGCNNNSNVAISWVDPTFDANTDLPAGTVLLQVTFKAKEDATLGSKAFEIFDYSVTGMFNEETYMPEDITPDPGSMIKYVEVIKPAGYNVSGSLTKSGSNLDATVELIKDGATVATATISGKTGTYAFETVVPGTYTIKVSKSKHASREYVIEVVDADVTQDVEIWLYGDVTGDGIINNTDVLQMNRRTVNLSSVFTLAAHSDYRIKIANITAITGTDTIINNTDILQVNRKIVNLSSLFDRIA